MRFGRMVRAGDHLELPQRAPATFARPDRYTERDRLRLTADTLALWYGDVSRAYDEQRLGPDYLGLSGEHTLLLWQAYRWAAFRLWRHDARQRKQHAEQAEAERKPDVADPTANGDLDRVLGRPAPSWRDPSPSAECAEWLEGRRANQQQEIV